jgi:hypothetical protein
LNQSHGSESIEEFDYITNGSVAWSTAFGIKDIRKGTRMRSDMVFNLTRSSGGLGEFTNITPNTFSRLGSPMFPVLERFEAYSKALGQPKLRQVDTIPSGFQSCGY